MSVEQVEAIRNELKAKGGTEGDWEMLLTDGMRVEDHQVYDGDAAGSGDPTPLASRVMAVGRIMEYSCFDGRWRSQGVSLMELKGFEDEKKRLIVGRHVKASDDYYEWYAGERLGEDRCVYHLCEGPGRRCRVKLTSRDRRELVHVPRWRVVSTGMMLNENYSREEGLARLKEGVQRFVPHPVAPPASRMGEGRGTGIDGVVEALGEPERRPEKTKRERSPKRKKGKEKDEGPRGSVGTLLREKARTYDENHPEKRKRKKKRKKDAEDERLEKKKRSRGTGDISTDSSDEESDGSSESVFHTPPARGGAELWRMARKHPGRLLKSGLTEMSRYLADRAGDDVGDTWHSRKVMAYVSQVMLNQGAGGQGVGVRNQREAITLATCLDHLTSGNLAALGDVLIQRLKALEAAMADQNWQSARGRRIRLQRWNFECWSWSPPSRRPRTNRDSAAEGPRGENLPWRHEEGGRVPAVGPSRRWSSTRGWGSYPQRRTRVQQER